MGNCHAFLASGLVHDAEDESVRLVRVTDGRTFEYPERVLVKDLIFGFEGFAVFHYSTIEHPLPLETELQFNEVYYLRPWTSPIELSELPDSEKSVSCKKIGCLRSPEQSPKRDQVKPKKVKFVDYSGQAMRVVPSRPSQQGHDTRRAGEATAKEPRQKNGVVHLKLVISKSQLSNLMTTAERSNATPDGTLNKLQSPKNVAAVKPSEPLTTEPSTQLGS